MKTCKFRRAAAVLLLCFTGTVSVFAQTAQSSKSSQTQTTEIAQTQTSDMELAMGWGGVTLGMTVEEVKAALLKNPQFGYRGDRDVSLLPDGDRILIETDTTRSNPNSFLSQCYFQFYQDRLYIITINVKTTKMDYYSIFTTLCSKYGNPPSMNPQKSEWKNGTVIMSLEKPLTLKYTDQKVFEELMKESMALESAEEMSRQKFLEGL